MLNPVDVPCLDSLDGDEDSSCSPKRLRRPFSIELGVVMEPEETAALFIVSSRTVYALEAQPTLLVWADDTS